MARVRLSIATVERRVDLEREITFERLPCVGELMRFAAPEIAHRAVDKVIHDENGGTLLVLADDLPENVRNTSYADLEKDIQDLTRSGWHVVDDSNEDE